MITINQGEKPEGIIFSDLGNLCEPAENIGTEDVIDKWVSVDYETATISGTMLSAQMTVSAKPVMLSPKLNGWYKIYVSLLDSPDNRVFLRLSGDSVQSPMSPSDETFSMSMWRWSRFQECLWKCADMTGQSVEISKRVGHGTAPCFVGWLRFVPMTEEEIAEYKHDLERKDTKRLMVSSDMHGVPVMFGANTPNEWRSIIENAKNTDVKIYSLEVNGFGETADGDRGPEFAFGSEGSRFVYDKMMSKTAETYSNMIDYGHECGMEIYLGRRMGARLGCVYPHDDQNRNTSFGRANQHLRCKDRDGAWVDAMSLAYEEVQDEAIDAFLKYAELNCDGVNLIYTRGIPYVLFEEPVIERFKQKYPDVNPCEVPLADERLYGVKCEIMTGFMRRLRTALDAKCKELGKAPIKIHVCVGSSLLDNKRIGLDVETWAKEGLINTCSVHILRITERLDGLMQDDNPDLIDLKKYSKAVRESFRKVVHRDVEGDFLDGTFKPMSIIELEHVDDYVAMAKKWGVEVYFDILPREQKSEEYIENALKLIEHGAENIALWDADFRMCFLPKWSTAAKLGHFEELKNGTLVQNPATLYRILSIRGRSISLYCAAWMS